jgi:hypothetical protein
VPRSFDASPRHYVKFSYTDVAIVDTGMRGGTTTWSASQAPAMELRGHVDDPHGEAACDTSGYHPTVVQLFYLGSEGAAKPLSKRDALCGEPRATCVLPDQGGWPRSFCFEELRPGAYTLIAFVDTAGTGRLDFSQKMSQPQGFFSTDGGWGGAQSIVWLMRGETTVPHVELQLRAPTRFLPQSVSCEGGWLGELKGQTVLHLRGDVFDRSWAHGFLAARQILDFLEFYIIEDCVGSRTRYECDVREALSTGVLSGSSSTLRAECAAIVEGMTAAGVNEIRSLGGRTVDTWDLLAINYMVHINNLPAFLPAVATSEQPQEPLAVALDQECSQFAAWGEATADGDVHGGTIIGRNMDGECDVRKVTVSHLILFAVEPTATGIELVKEDVEPPAPSDKQHRRRPARFVSILWPGCVGACSGFNEHGLWVMNNAGSMAPGLAEAAAARPQSSMMWVVRQLLESHSGEGGLSASAVSSLICETQLAGAEDEGTLQNGKILFIGQRHADGCDRPDGCAFAYEGDHQGGWTRTARSNIPFNGHGIGTVFDSGDGLHQTSCSSVGRSNRLQWNHALLATNHNMDRGAAYNGDAALDGVPSSVFGRDVSYSSRWRYTAGSHALDALIRGERPVTVAAMKRLLQTVAQGTTEHSIILRPDTRPMLFEVSNATESALQRGNLWDAPHGTWTEFTFDEVFIGTSQLPQQAGRGVGASKL